MRKKYAPHEPEEDMLSAADAFRDAEQSDARWQTFERDQKLHRLLVEPEQLFFTISLGLVSSSSGSRARRGPLRGTAAAIACDPAARAAGKPVCRPRL